MTIWVDDMRAEFKPRHRPGMTYVMSHMISDDEAELHAMATKIGVARKWYQGDHYDITQSAKAKAIKLGAVQITWLQAGTMMTNRRNGYPMGTPETCLQIRERRREDRKRRVALASRL
jgi:hypothetical protein